MAPPPGWRASIQRALSSGRKSGSLHWPLPAPLARPAKSTVPAGPMVEPGTKPEAPARREYDMARVRAAEDDRCLLPTMDVRSRGPVGPLFCGDPRPPATGAHT